MLLTITTTHRPATDIGYLLYKNPSRFQSFALPFGQAHVFYPEAGEERCTAALLLDVDPIGLVRGRKGPVGEGASLREYVNDRPYVASSFLSVAISSVFGTAMAGRCKDRPELAKAEIPLQATLAVLPSRGRESVLRRLFEPLGYKVTAKGHALDERFPEWGQSEYFTVTLDATCRLKDLLTHVYVLVPVLDDEKHYWVGADEVDKLLRHGESWLAAHPERELIVNRYLRHHRRLTRQALSRLTEEDNPDVDSEEEVRVHEEEALETRLGLNEQRLGAVVAALKSLGAKKVVDLGCGEGRLLASLMRDRAFEEIVGMDVSYRALEIATRRLHLESLPDKQKERLRLIQGSLTYRDKRLAGFDAAAAVEVVEHLDPPRLAAFERVLFQHARPEAVVLTTPNAEYNAKLPNLPAGRLRHRDHRFEWRREEFQSWCRRVGQEFGYTVSFLAVGPENSAVGPPTQMAIFKDMRLEQR